MSDRMMDEQEYEALEQAFERALAHGDDGRGPALSRAWNAVVNNDLLALFGDSDWLSHSDVLQLCGPPSGTWLAGHYWQAAGTTLHYATALGLVREERCPKRGRRWHLVHREPQWIFEGRGAGEWARQVRGLPPAQQAAEDRRQVSLAKRRATLDRKARYAADDEIATLIARILAVDPDAVVPESLTRDPALVQDWLPGRRIDSCSGVLRQSHHALEMDRATLRDWIDALDQMARSAPAVRAWRLHGLTSLPVHAVIPEADADALEALL